MNQHIYGLLNAHKILLPKFAALDIPLLRKKRSLRAWLGVDMSGYYVLVLLRNASSRLLVKEALLFVDAKNEVEEIRQHSVKRLIFFYKGQACSKALKLLSQEGFKCIGYNCDSM